MTRNRRPNLVSVLHPNRLRPSRYRWLWRALWLGAVIVAGMASSPSSDRTVRVIGLVGLVFLILGGAIAWLAGAAARLSSSGRAMSDYEWPGDSHAGLR